MTKMKRLFVCVLLLVGLTACAGGAAPNGWNCDKGVCIKVRAAEPVRMDELVTVTITVTAEKDVPELKVFLSSCCPPSALIEDEQGWKKGGVNWDVDAKANRPLVFTRRVRFPPDEGLFNIMAEAYTPGLHATDSIVIHLTRAGGKIYLAGTSVPIPGWTPGQPAPAVTVTPGPSPTFIPTPARALSPLATPMQSLSPLSTPTRSTLP